LGPQFETVQVNAGSVEMLAEQALYYQKAMEKIDNAKASDLP
jgi:hypothetical protein